MENPSTAAGWWSGVLRVPPPASWKVISRDVLGRGGLHTMEKAELFMRRHFSEFEIRAGIWQDIKAGKYGDFDVGHKRARATNPQHAHVVDNHVFERRSYNRSHKAGDMPKSYWKGEADFFRAAKFKAVAFRGIQAGAAGAVYGAAFEIPFSAVDAYLDMREGVACKAALKTAAKKVGIASLFGGGAGLTGWLITAALPPVTPWVIGVPLVLLGTSGISIRLFHQITRYFSWPHDQQLVTASQTAQLEPSTATGMVIPPTSSPSSRSTTTASARFKP